MESGKNMLSPDFLGFDAQAALEELYFGNVGCSIHACQALRDLLREAGHLRSLHLYNNMSDDTGAQAIAQARTFYAGISAR